MIYLFITESEDKSYELCIDYRESDQDDPFVVFKTKDANKVAAKGNELRNILVNSGATVSYTGI